MEFLKAWIFLQHKLRDKGQEIDETLLKYVENLYNQLKGLLDTKLVKRTKTGDFELAALADAQVEIRELKELNEMIEKSLKGNIEQLKKELKAKHEEKEILKSCVEFYSHEKFRDGHDGGVLLPNHRFDISCAACCEENKGRFARKTLRELKC